jgi:hypothetical protein
MVSEKTKRIAALNDQLRSAVEDRPELDLFGFYETPYGLVRVTDGVRFHPKRKEILNAVKNYDFSQAHPGDDPYHERDLVVLQMDGRLYAKTDYYDSNLVYHSPDPADAAITRRVICVMRAEEY